MKTILISLVFTTILSAMTLTMDSVTVDSVWNSDSAGIVQRDCKVSFIPQGDMKRVSCVPFVSFDGGTTWYSDSICSIHKAIDTMLLCGKKKTIMIRIKGGDRNNIIIKVTARMPLPTMVSIAGGAFQMGSIDEPPVHSVTITAFKMGSTEVTQELYTAVMGVNPAGFATDGTKPVETVSWYDAALFCNALSKLSGKDTIYTYTGTIGSNVVIDYTKNGYRMPTEAEWEYACRAGTTTDYYWGKSYPPTTNADTAAIDSNAVWDHNSNALGSSSADYGTHKAGSKKPNAWGLYDMSGNVMEWVNNWYESYPAEEQTDPAGPTEAGIYARMVRGGAWHVNDGDLLSANRDLNLPDARHEIIGFRLTSRP